MSSLDYAEYRATRAYLIAITIALSGAVFFTLYTLATLQGWLPNWSILVVQILFPALVLAWYYYYRQGNVYYKQSYRQLYGRDP